MAAPTLLRILPLAEFKPISTSRAWVSIPNPNGLPLIATATSDKTARVYSLKNFTLHSILEGGHTRSVRSLAWKPTVKNTGTLYIATGSFDSTMAIWKRQEASFAGKEAPKQEHIEQFDDNEDGLEFEIKSGRVDDEDSEKGDDWEFSIVLEGHDSEIKTVAYSPSGQWLASCSRDKSIWVWEEIGDEGEDEFETVAVLQEHTADVKFVSWRVDDGNGEVLASASYDDTIRFWRGDDEGEWSCIAVLEGHEGTVWSLDWEPEISQKTFDPEPDEELASKDYSPHIPRLISSSADCTVRVWTKAPSPPPPNRPSYFNTGIPSTMRPPPAEETWEFTATLPKVHDLPVYSVSWSKKTGRVVSTGGDGKIVVYEERKKGRTVVGGPIEREWVVVAVLQGGHGPYEVNHVTWCTRYDAGKKEEGEEMVVTTGDDGVVRAWAIEEIVARQGVVLPVLDGKPDET
jgi:WD40 repeat protein